MENEIPCSKLDTMLQSLYHDRIIQEQSSLCGNIFRDAREFRQSLKQQKPAPKEETVDEEERLPSSPLDQLGNDNYSFNLMIGQTSVSEKEVPTMAEF